MNEWGIASVPFFSSLLALLVVVGLTVRLRGFPRGNSIMNALQEEIQEGAKSFLVAEYQYLLGFVTVFAGLLFVLFGAAVPNAEWIDGVNIMVCFVIGAMLSAAAGWFGMQVATEANEKTTQAAMDGLPEALKVAFTGGSIMGFTVVGLGLGGVSILFIIMQASCDETKQPTVHQCMNSAMSPLAGFGFGASAIALFARVAGGIFTKAADVGADLVGKVESGIPEDDPRNPAVIADNVGDNVGDVAGMGADLFESFVGSLIAAMTLATPTASAVTAAAAAVATAADKVTLAPTAAMTGAPTSEVAVAAIMAVEPILDLAKVALPFWLAGGGIVCSFIGFLAVRLPSTVKGQESSFSQKQLLSVLHRGTYLSSLLVIGWSIALVFILFPGREEEGWKYFGCIIIGLVTGILIGEATEYFTSYEYKPTFSIMNAGKTGPATVIIQGLGVGMLSVVPPVFLLVAAVLSCTALGDEYGVAVAAVGMLSTLGITLATDAYGPVADNAGGIAEMALCEPIVRQRTDDLDALGNTTAATGKGFAIGSAVLTALSLLAAFKQTAFPNGPGAGVTLDVTDSVILSGVIFGAMLPYLFAALTMLSVGKAAGAIIKNVREQFGIEVECPITKIKCCLAKESFADNWGHKFPKRGQKKTKEELKLQRDAAVNAMKLVGGSAQCVTIATESSVKEMVLPGAYAILSPALIGMLVGPACLAGMLVGAIASGCMLGIMMSNAGGAWDNSKKYVEIECQRRADLPEGSKENPHNQGFNTVKKSAEGAEKITSSDGTVVTWVDKTKPSYDLKGKHGKLEFNFIPKHTLHHDACVVGDTVGDPFKDTSGPALNILIKLMSMIALTIAPLMEGNGTYEDWGYGLIPLGLCIVATVIASMWAGGVLDEADVGGKEESKDKGEEMEEIKDEGEMVQDLAASGEVSEAYATAHADVTPLIS